MKHLLTALAIAALVATPALAADQKPAAQAMDAAMSNDYPGADETKPMRTVVSSHATEAKPAAAQSHKAKSSANKAGKAAKKSSSGKAGHKKTDEKK